MTRLISINYRYKFPKPQIVATDPKSSNSYEFPEPAKSLNVVKELLKVGPEVISGEVKNHEAAKADENVVWQDGEAVVLQGKAEEVRRVGEHGRVNVLDFVVGQVEAADGGCRFGQC